MLALTLVAALAVATVSACNPSNSTSPSPSPSPEATAPPSPEPASSLPTALFLGDSYTAGTGLTADQLPSRWPTRVSEAMGWQEANFGCNGSGYTARGQRCGNSYVTRIPLLEDLDPEFVFVSGGVNDFLSGEEEVTAAIDQTFTDLRAAFPDAQMFAVGSIFYTGDERPEPLQRLNDAVESAAASVDAEYADIGEPLLGRPDLMAPDGLHPNPEGHAVIADLTLEAFNLQP
jgi:lysophospholipase L1-like esterase